MSSLSADNAPLAPELDHDAIRMHVRMLHVLAKAAGVDGVLVLTRIDPMRGDVHAERFAIGDDAIMADAIVGWSGNADVNLYSSFAVFRKDLPAGARGGEADVRAVLAFVGDLDSDKGKTSIALDDLPLEAPYVIESSAGNFQPFWPLAKAMTVADAKPIAERLGDALGGDKGTKDLCHIWRIPGTLNWPSEVKLKRGRSPIPQLVTVATPWEGDLVELEDIKEAIEDFGWTPSPTASEAKGHTRCASDEDAVEYTDAAFQDLPLAVRERIVSAAGINEDRSETAASVIWSLFKRNWSDKAIEEVIAAHPHGIGARYTKKGKNLGKDVKRLRRKWDNRDDIEGPPPGAVPHKGGRAGADTTAAADKRHLAATPYTWTDPAKLPQRSWLYGRLLIRKFASMTVAPGGTGKSSLITAETLAQVSGRNLIGIEPSGRLRVWLWNLEDPAVETQRKVQAAALHYKLGPEDIGDRLFIDSGRDQSLVIATMTRDGPTIVRPVVDALIEEVIAKQIDVIVVDPFVSCHETPENDNNAADRIVKEWAAVADRCNCAVHLVDHTRKAPAGTEVTTDSARGGKAKTDGARVVRVVNLMSQDEGEKAGVLNHRLHFRTYNDKGNLAPPAETSEWFKLESVNLGNGPVVEFDGNPIATMGDSVGVVTAWQWPDPLEGMTGNNFDAVAAEIRAGVWRENSQCADWVGVAVAKGLGLNQDDKAARNKVKGLIKALIGSGRLVTVTRKDDQRRDRKFIEVAAAEG